MGRFSDGYFKVVYRNVVTCASHNNYVHLLQSLFLYSLLNNWRLIIGYFILNGCMRHTRQSPTEPLLLLKGVSPLWGDPDCCFCVLNAPFYCLKSKEAGAISTSSIKLMQLHKVADTILVPQPSRPPPVTPLASELAPPSTSPSSSQPSSSIPQSSPFFHSAFSHASFLNLNSAPPPQGASVPTDLTSLLSKINHHFLPPPAPPLLNP